MPGSNRLLQRELIWWLLGPNLGTKADVGVNLVGAVEEGVALGGGGRSQVAAAQCLCLVSAALLLHVGRRMDSNHNIKEPGSYQLHKS